MTWKICKVIFSLKQPQPLARSSSIFTDEGCQLARPRGKGRRGITKIEWYPGELFARLGVIVINLPVASDWVVGFHNQRGTTEQHIKKGKYAFEPERVFRRA